MAHNHKSHPQAPLYGPGGSSGTDLLTQLTQYQGALSIGWSQLTSVPTTISGYGITDAYTESEVDALLADKADAATTLAGYGITDAYTETEVDALLLAKADAETAVFLSVNRATTDQSLTVGGSTNIIFNNVLTDTASAYSTTTGKFTAPSAGKYLVAGALTVLFATSQYPCILVIDKNGNPAGLSILTPYVGLSSGMYAAILDLDAGDTVNLHVNVPSTASTSTLQAAVYTRMEISKLFNA